MGNTVLETTLAKETNPLITNQMASEAQLSCSKGNSGSDGTGVDVSGATAIDCYTDFGFYPRRIYIETGGNVGFATLDENVHVLPVDDKTWIDAIFIKTIYPATFATAGYRTTATGIHVF